MSIHLIKFLVVGRELIHRAFDWLGDNRDLQRAFVVFLNNVYFIDRVDVEELYHEATTKEVRAMLEKNVERWIEEWKAEGRVEGRAKGRAEGKAEGRAEGRVQGEAQGWIKGQTDERRRLAKKMLSSGMPIARVAQLTDLSEDELRELVKPKTN